MRIRPLNNYVIVKLDPADEKVGNLWTAAASGQEKFDIPKRTGVVLRVGRGLVTAGGQIIPPQCQPGDRVLIAESGMKGQITTDYDGEKCHIFSSEEQILGVIEAE